MTIRPAEVADCIRSSELFSFLSTDERAVAFLSDCFRAVSFTSGNVIIREGDEGDSMLMMLSGTVRIDTKIPAGEQYTVATLNEEQACFGELSLFDS
ncbi:MAG TPA: cyclic nucleotide-binding domain-containing protein [Acidobacteriota bacterium]|nr:cyclic nucleotide-binding domain-containing protein [Acidobacteriota bacterium]